MRTYVDEEQCAHNQTRQRKAVADLLHDRTSRAESRRGDVRTAVVVDDNADGEIEASHDRLAEHQGAVIVAWVAHLRGDREERRGAGIGEDNR